MMDDDDDDDVLNFYDKFCERAPSRAACLAFICTL